MDETPRHILILEPDRTFAVRLTRALKKIAPFEISVVPSVRDGCLELMQQSQSVAFIPASESSKIVRSFRAVQPDLRLILMTPTADFDVPTTYSGSVQAVLIKPLLDVELPTVLEEGLEQPVLGTSATKKATTPEIEIFDTSVVDEALAQVHLSRLVQSVVFAHGQTMLSFSGDLQEKEAGAIAIHVGRDWSRENPSRLQFLHLPARKGDMLLYSRQVVQNYFVTLVALPETPIGELRSQAAQLVVMLKKIVLGQTGPLSSGIVGEQAVDGRSTFALAWRPTRPLPFSLIIPLRRSLERIASENACILTHTHVEGGLAHVVINCPPGRDSTWAAYLLKNGSERKIQEEFGVVANLWDTGFYASRQTDPLTDEELRLFLERERSG